MDPNEPPLFDSAAIDRLRAAVGDDPAFVSEIATLFIVETDKYFVEMKASRDSRDWLTVSRHAHSLKSSSATLGLMRFSAAAKALELHAKATPLDEAKAGTALDELVAQFETAKASLQAVISPN